MRHFSALLFVVCCAALSAQAQQTVTSTFVDELLATAENEIAWTSDNQFYYEKGTDSRGLQSLTGAVSDISLWTATPLQAVTGVTVVASTNFEDDKDSKRPYVAVSVGDVQLGRPLYLRVKPQKNTEYNFDTDGKLMSGVVKLAFTRKKPATLWVKQIIITTNEEALGVSTLKADATAHVVYNLQGQRVTRMVHGFYVVDGHKVWVP